MSRLPELLAPAGSPEAVTAAVQSGADAVYLGCGDFNARRRAKNFGLTELAQAVNYCHVRGVKVYLTLNTLLTDRELPAALDLAAQANAMGVDAVLVQDLGLARALKARFPDLPLHASTQMTVHSLAGVELCAELGMERVVLSRELDRTAIAHICQKSPIEIEVFVHGALCMCYSGQCFLSALVGGRSGNRGLCAQPCRLPYNGAHPLSLKDMSLAGHLRELAEMGVACLKLEGRMKRPEYVAVVTKVYADALRENREPTREELESLERAFSRSGFTQGYFLDEKGPQMFGTRAKADAGAPDDGFYAAARESYRKEAPLVGVELSVTVKAGRDISATASDGAGHTAHAAAPAPEIARNRATTAQEIQEQLGKTGGTPYFIRHLDLELDEGLAVAKSALNALRRGLLEELTGLRSAPPKRRELPLPPLPGCPQWSAAPPRWVFSFSSPAQMPEDIFSLAPAWIDLPLSELAAHPQLLDKGNFRAVLPTIVWDREAGTVREQLRTLARRGLRHALVNTWDASRLAKEEGFALHGDYGLAVYNSRTLEALRELGFESATVSFEQKLSALRHLNKPLPTEAIVYGRLPLMTLEQFPGGAPCDALTDRKNVTFPVLPAPGGRARLLNSQVLYLADKPEWRSAGLAYARFLFTTETARECAEVLRRYESGQPPEAQGFTRGLYYRDVE